MRAAILCPGPSVTRFQGRDGYDALVAVNRAARVYACDYWCCLDWRTFGMCTKLGKPQAITRAYNWHRVDDSRDWPIWDVALFRWFRTAPEHWTYSALTALAFLAWRGYSEIDVYGRDLDGVADWDGWDASRVGRSDTRWKREQRAWGLVTKKAAVPVRFC
jgi:hypothetical protein